MSQRLRLYHKTLIAQHVTIILAIIFLCIGSFFVGRQVMSTLQTINTAGNDINDTFTVINRPRTGTLAGLNEVIFGVDALVKKSNKVLDHEEKQLTTLDRQEAILFDDLHAIAVKAKDEVGTLNTTTTTLNTLLGNLNKSAEKVPTTIDNLNQITTDADKKINDPSVKKIIDSMAGTSSNVEGITGSIDKMTKHLEQEVDNPKKGIVSRLNAIWNVAWQIATLVK